MARRKMTEDETDIRRVEECLSRLEKGSPHMHEAIAAAYGIHGRPRQKLADAARSIGLSVAGLTYRRDKTMRWLCHPAQIGCSRTDLENAFKRMSGE